MKNTPYAWIAVPTIGALLSFGGMVWQTRASADAIKTLVPQSEFQLVVTQLNRLEDKVDRLTQLVEEHR